MKYAMIILCGLLAGCGSTRQENKNTVEKYRETTTTSDGHVTTKEGQRTIEEKSQSETKIDLKPAIDPTWLSMLAGFVGGPGFSQIVTMLMTGYAMHQRGQNNGMKRQLEVATDDLNEQWAMNKANMNKGA